MADTPHNHPVVFGRREAGCGRCFELRMGAPKRAGWGDNRRRFEAQAVAALRAHDCQTSRCGVVCTHGDW